MEGQWSLICVDAGSEYCPCHLAENGTCLACSLLSGEDFCDCRWSGSCSYLNYQFSQGVINKRSECTVLVNKKRLTPSLLDLRFRPKTSWLPKFAHAGTFLFLRPADAPYYAAVPISIVNITADEVWLVVNCIGPKSSLLMRTDSQVIIRGPYYGALTNSHVLKKTRDANVIMVAGGTGQSALVLAAKTLLRGGNRLWACLAPGSTDLIYVGQTLRKYGVEVNEVSSLRRYGAKIIMNQLTQLEPSLVICAGPEELQTTILTMLCSIGSKAEFVHTKNNVMCCGEGLCGSCLTNHFGQKRVPLCKAQYSFRGGN